METAWKRKLVGIFDTIAGAFALLFGFLVAATLLRLKTPPLPLQMSLSAILASSVVLGLLAVAGGVSALRSGIWWLTMTGSISASVCFPPLGIPATIIVLLSGNASKLLRLLVFVVFGPLWLAAIGFLAIILLGYWS